MVAGRVRSSQMFYVFRDSQDGFEFIEGKRNSSMSNRCKSDMTIKAYGCNRAKVIRSMIAYLMLHSRKKQLAIDFLSSFIDDENARGIETGIHQVQSDPGEFELITGRRSGLGL